MAVSLVSLAALAKPSGPEHKPSKPEQMPPHFPGMGPFGVDQQHRGGGGGGGGGGSNMFMMQEQLPKSVSHNAAPAEPTGDLLDEIHAAEREQLAMQTGALMLRQTLDAQSSLLERAQKDATRLSSTESTLRRSADLERAKGSVPGAPAHPATPATPAMPAPATPATPATPARPTWGWGGSGAVPHWGAAPGSAAAAAWQQWEGGERRVSNDLEAEEELADTAEELLSRLHRGEEVQSHLEKALKQAAHLQGQIDSARRVLSGFRRDTLREQLRPPGAAGLPMGAVGFWGGVGAPTALPGATAGAGTDVGAAGKGGAAAVAAAAAGGDTAAALRALRSEHRALTDETLRHVEAQQSLERHLDAALQMAEPPGVLASAVLGLQGGLSAGAVPGFRPSAAPGFGGLPMWW